MQSPSPDNEQDDGIVFHAPVELNTHTHADALEFDLSYYDGLADVF
jgi:hypothetical protein